MKRLLCLIILFLVFCGCHNGKDQLDDSLSLRQQLLSSDKCTFTAEITADYGEELYQFTVECQGDKQGNLEFSVVAPESIAGITGKITELGGSLTFDDTVLAFPPMADGQFTPAAAPWIFLKTLRSGYIVSSTSEGSFTYLQIDDSYSDEALHLDIWLNEEQNPVRGEILWQGRRILSLSVKDFKIL